MDGVGRHDRLARYEGAVSLALTPVAASTGVSVACRPQTLKKLQ